MAKSDEAVKHLLRSGPNLSQLSGSIIPQTGKTILQCFTNTKDVQYDPLTSRYTRFFAHIGDLQRTEASLGLLLDAGVDIEAFEDRQTSHGLRVRRTALNHACINLNADAIRLLLERGANVRGAVACDTEDHEKKTRPIYAAPTPSFDILNVEEVRRSRRNEFGPCNELQLATKTALMCECLRVLIEYDGVANMGLWSTTGVLLKDVFFACVKSYVDSSELWSLLLDNGVLDVKQTDRMGQTLLNKLISRYFGGRVLDLWKPNLVRCLVEHGADPNTVDDSGMTPLQYGILYGDCRAVHLLVELGADPGRRIAGISATHYAFGRSFVPKGRVLRKILRNLRRQLLRYGLRVRDDFEYPKIDKDGWHPALNCAADPFIYKYFPKMADDTLDRCVEIKRFLSPWDSVSVDENGQTPREVADKIKLIICGGDTDPAEQKEGSEQELTYDYRKETESDGRESREHDPAWFPWYRRFPPVLMDYRGYRRRFLEGEICSCCHI
ncbi:ankyrin repeat-containing domain protein [Whalleya microplaca]|nr:ankyrin repeat-containing domain protein [Whalleya microplaca]